MTKEEILSRIDSESPNINQVKIWIDGMASTKLVTSLRKGDVIAYTLYKKRPVVIIKVLKNIVYAIPLSSTEDELNLCSYSSRQFKSGFFSRQIIAIKSDIAKKDFIGTLDNNKDLNKAIKLLKELIIKL